MFPSRPVSILFPHWRGAKVYSQTGCGPWPDFPSLDPLWRQSVYIFDLLQDSTFPYSACLSVCLPVCPCLSACLSVALWEQSGFIFIRVSTVVVWPCSRGFAFRNLDYDNWHSINRDIQQYTYTNTLTYTHAHAHANAQSHTHRY